MTWLRQVGVMAANPAIQDATTRSGFDARQMVPTDVSSSWAPRLDSRIRGNEIQRWQSPSILSPDPLVRRLMIR